MSLKSFFKSVTFKCIYVLLAIALVAGGLLSILNDVLSVSDEEKLQRVINKQYDDPSVSANVYELTEDLATNSFGTINVVYELSDGNLIVNATGGNGYKGGSVTAWVIVEINDGHFAGIKSVAVDSYDKQTLMSQLGNKFTGTYSANNAAVLDGKYFSSSDSEETILNVSTGATMSSNATNGAVNAAIKFAKLYTGDEVMSDLVNPDSVKNVKFAIDGTKVTYEFTAVSVSNGMPNNYDLKVVVDAGKIVSIDVVTDGATSGYGAKVKDIQSYVGMGAAELNAFLASSDISTGATNSNKTLVNALIHATANYDYYLAGPTLADPVQDLLDAKYGEGAMTYSEIENLDPDMAVTATGTVEKAYKLSNDAILVAIEGASPVYVLVSDGKAEALSEGANDNALKAAEQFVAYYTGAAKVLPYQRYVKDVNVTISGANITYKLTALTVQHEMPNDYALSITVANGKVSRLSITTDGATYGYGTEIKAKDFQNKNYDELLAYLNSDDIHTGSTNSRKTIVNALLYATYNYDYYLNGDLVNGGSVSDIVTSVDGSVVNYEVTAKSVSSGMPENYKLKISVDGGKLTAIEIVVNGATSGYDKNEKAVADYLGLGTDELKALIADGSLSTGATNSNTTIVNALVFATANYEYYLAGGNA